MFGIADYGAFVVAIIVFLAIPFTNHNSSIQSFYFIAFSRINSKCFCDYF